VHRRLDDYFRGRKDFSGQNLDLTEIGEHITFTEQRADDAEKELKTVLILQMLSGRIGDELDCVVTGLAGFGVFVQCKKFGIEGLVQVGDLGPDIWKYNQKARCITAQRSGCTVRLGQAMKVRIVSVNVPARQLNLSPVESLIKAGKKVYKPKENHRRKKVRSHRFSRKKR
jgi:ribonuclease R